MTDPIDTTRATRRGFLAGAAGLAATGTTAALADNAKNLPPNVADWTRQLGEGVGVRGYGNPSKYEKDVIRRDRVVAHRDARNRRSASRHCISSTELSRRMDCASSGITAALRRSTRPTIG